MSSFSLTQSQNRLQQNVELFGDHIFQLEVLHVIHISIAVLSFMESIGIAYLVHLNRSSTLFLLEEVSEDWFDSDKAYF
jgi:hypothetical protein